MTTPWLYRITAIGRPLDPRYRSNLLLLLLLPGAALAAGLLGAGALAGALAAFGAWALTRELAPDDDPAAFVSVALGFAALLAFGVDSLLPVFVALLLCRVVNRSTGLPATPLDSLLVGAFVTWAALRLGQPLLLLSAAAAFALEATLHNGRPWQLVTASTCLFAGIGLVLARGLEAASPLALDAGPTAVLGAILLLFGWRVRATRAVLAPGDVGGLPLDPRRVRSGMLVGASVPLQALVTGADGPTVEVLTWACLAGTGLGGLLPRGRAGRSTSGT